MVELLSLTIFSRKVIGAGLSWRLCQVGHQRIKANGCGCMDIFLCYANNPKYKELIFELAKSREAIKMEFSEIEKARLSYLSRLIADMDYVTAMAGARKEAREEVSAEHALKLIKFGIKDDVIMATTGVDSDTIKEMRAEWELEKANAPTPPPTES
jgi:hypothetical protein